jgi:hypothetical protein
MAYSPLASDPGLRDRGAGAVFRMIVQKSRDVTDSGSRRPMRVEVGGGPRRLLAGGPVGNHVAVAVCLCLVLFAGAILPKFIGLARQSLWLDELNVVRFMTFPAMDGDFLAALRNEPHPPLYLVLMWIYGRLAGTEEPILRLSSAAVGAGAVVAMYVGVFRLFGMRIAVMTSALFGMSSVGLYEAQNVRPYSLLLLVGVVSTAAFVAAVRRTEVAGAPGGRTMLGLCGANLFLCLVHYSALLFVAGQCLCLSLQLLRHAGWRRAWPYVLAAGAPVAPALLWLAWTLQLYEPTLATVKRSWTILDAISPLRAFFGQPTMLILVIGPLLAIRRRGRRRLRQLAARPPEALLLAALVSTHVALVFAAALIHPGWMQNKNFIVAFPAGYLLFAVLLADSRVLRGVAGPIVVILVSVVALVSYLATGYPHHDSSFYAPFRHQVREAARYIERTARADDTVLFGSVDMNGGGFYLQPTAVYLRAVQAVGSRLRATDLRTFVAIGDTSTRLDDIRRAVTERRPQGRLIIDLPHRSSLGRMERGYLDEVATCVAERPFIGHRVLLVLFSTEGCVGLRAHLAD